MTNNTDDLTMEDANGVNIFFTGLMKERTPEKEEAFQAVLDEFKISFEVDDSEERCLFVSNSSSGIITVGLIGMTRLLMHVYAYVTADYGLIQHMVQKKTEPFDHSSIFKTAVEIYKFSFNLDRKSILSDFEKSQLSHILPDKNFIPDKLRHQLNAHLPKRQQEAANGIYANAVVWILYHEVAHIQMGHMKCKGDQSLEQERLADSRASEWMLNSENIETIEFQKRQFGAASALGWLTSKVPYSGAGPSETHPAAYDRLSDLLTSYFPDDQTDVNCYTQTILKLQLDSLGQKVSDDRLQGTVPENIQYLIDLISQTGENQ